MNRDILLQEMKACVGTQEPIVFFEKMVDVFVLLFNRIDELEADIKQANLKAALAIQWEPKMASTMISSMIEELRDDKEAYFDEISALKRAFVEDKVTKNYNDFCVFWEKTLGWHPFLDYK